MRREERHNKNNTVTAVALSAIVTVAHFIAQMVGFDKMDLGATPKSFFEVAAEWPKFLLLGMIYFIVVLCSLASKIDPEYVICGNCRHVSEQKSESISRCKKCGGKLEYLEGFYDRHPELR